ncbi:MAG: bifunctional diaminohydroxyphosphoribosylaminopyrimidine deaminase/5-amino-6-(5-phosphoribosylamino)uracil reductase RibD [Pseudomonadales bacterium]|jgi:diaminohydroxyphosphoribosylaminopyrimidine deaminase/5-amino-6-(5-phosphoribosylamino)uracil reductase|tara:strand:- start:8279 stop:9358 length:1080 start_codon:yes stop_codon:yes gene_type:complete
MDQTFLAQAFRLAQQGRFTTDPNPRVGCVLVRDGRVIGEGFHQTAGGPHAEAEALANATESVTGATAYVTLEPCSYHGRTPSCAQALIKAGVARVVAAAPDPHARNRGTGFDLLEAAGIEVIRDGDLEGARALNPGHEKTHSEGKPYVRLKLAATLDGFTALPNGESQWITSPAARLEVQRLRAQSSAIVTGANTVLTDDPELTVRDPRIDPNYSDLILSRRKPVYVLDSQSRTALAAKVYGNPLARQVCGLEALNPHPNALKAKLNANGQIDLPLFFEALAAKGVLEVLVECGPTLAGAVMQANLVDELVLFLAPKFMGAGKPLLQLPELDKMSDLRGWSLSDMRRIGPDLKLVLKPD